MSSTGKPTLVYSQDINNKYYNIYWLNYNNNDVYKTIEHVNAIKSIINYNNIPMILTKISLKCLLFLKSKRKDLYIKFKGTFDRLQTEL